MKLILDGKINVYYIQTLCMIFLPGEKFGTAEQENPDASELYVRLSEQEDGVEAYVKLTLNGSVSTAEKGYSSYTGEYSDRDKAAKMACGAAVIAAFGAVTGYRPSWGMLTGVRPSKVAMELLQEGYSKTRVKRVLTNEYFVIPKKAALATDVALNEQRLIEGASAKDCSVYISIPFCPSRCSYCSFVSYTSSKLLSLIPDYLVRLCQDLRQMFAKIRELGLRVRTVYIGGGTPTILSGEQLRVLLSAVAESTDVTALEEYTLESGRPDTITAEKMAVARQYGVTRACVNPQTLCDEVLRGIGRCHTAEDFLRAYATVRESGIPVINTDLIAGLPGDSFRTFSATLDRILTLRPENITVHTFCIKKAAEILRQGRNVYSVQGGDAGKCVDYSQLKTQQEGYLPYYMYRQKNTVGNFENVGFALSGTEGLYNIYMMEEVHSVFAIGAGAVSKMVDYRPKNGSKPVIERLFYPKYPYEYLRDESTGEKTEAMETFYRAHGMTEN